MIKKLILCDFYLEVVDVKCFLAQRLQSASRDSVVKRRYERTQLMSGPLSATLGESIKGINC